MKKLILFYLTLFTLNIFAQFPNFELQAGSSQKKGTSEGHLGLVAYTKDGYYKLRLQSGGFVNKKYKGNLKLDYFNKKLRYSKEIDLEDIQYSEYGKAEKNYEFFIKDLADNIYVFYSYEDKKFSYLYRRTLNKKSNKFEDEVLVHKSAAGKKKYLSKKQTYGAFLSDDKTKTAIVNFHGLSPKSNNTTVSALILDNKNLSTIWKNEFETDFTSNNNLAKKAYLKQINPTVPQQNTFQIKVNNSGELHFLIKIADGDSGGYFKTANSQFRLYAANKNELKRKSLNSEDYFMVEAAINYDEFNNIVCSGFYSKNKNKADYDGIAYYQFESKNLNLIKSDFVEIENNLKREGSFYLRDFVKLSDKSTTLISEEYHSTSNPSNGNSFTTHYFGDLIFINLNENGKINWIKEIDKNQSDPDFRILGIKLFFNNDKIYFLYNKFSIGNKVTLSIGMIDEYGEYEDNTLSKISKNPAISKMYVSPISLKSVDGNEIIGFARKLLKTKIIKLDVNGLELYERQNITIEKKTSPTKLPIPTKQKSNTFEKKLKDLEQEFKKIENQVISIDKIDELEEKLKRLERLQSIIDNLEKKKDANIE